ncbi:MAG: ATP-binding cassette domain-containing protein [Acidimicrobiales bacterium]
MTKLRRLEEVEMLELEVLPGWDAAPRQVGETRRTRAETVLSVLGLDVRYGRRTVVSDLDLSVQHGEVVALIGHNGCGKSSTLNAIFGLVAPDCGEVLVNGVPLLPDMGAAAAAGVGLVPATRNVFDDLAVRENLRLGGRQEPDVAELERRTARVLALFPELEARLDIAAGKLSGGEQRMVGLAIALMAQPQLLLLDEPTQALSPSAASRVLNAVRALADERDTAVLLAEVNVASALRIADRVYVMNNGAIRSQHTGEELRAAGPLGWWRLF